MFLFRNSKRHERLEGYRKIRSTLEQLSDHDLADMGIKRYQLGHVARVQALGRG
jgi:uncharacterized protein YjiS (DUF1127 family)